MAPIKFEEDIKSTLEKRRIEPSKMAWDTLEKSLDNDFGENKKKPFWWIGIAASIIGILWISISFFNREDVIVEPMIVDVPNGNIKTQTKVTTNKKADKIIEEDDIIDRPITSVNQELVAVEIHPKKIKKESIYEIENPQNINITKEVLIAKVEVELPVNISEEEKQIQQVAAQIAVLEKENATDAEIDNLLKKAQQKIANQKFKESGMSVSAYALLFEVEEELDPTFKEKVFDILSENYHSVKNAVAQRND